ncbi:DUF2167 domain-containing protein [Leptospira semungkisensis]|uniref:DUF2167 domain-containing protein n=1 Tax=Leptospira semungkisensis TaxID=2484985 RepID=A0A4R9G771_9LEPT|nr:DUF2167 domain-containing protein [Leptospira semungkisensis]TGK06840.1 DUF2167 domain-containing protein [Leptospira semungkisensis]
MIRRIVVYLVVGIFLWSGPASAQKFATDEDLVKWIHSLKYETNTVPLADKEGKVIANIKVPKGYKYLNAKDSKIVLEDVWGNPPNSEPGLGILFIATDSPLDLGNYVITIDYVEEGHVDDEDSKEIKYDELLSQLKDSTKEESEQRKKDGYPGLELVGWASSPYYDSTAKKLHWAKEYKFDGTAANTLNYNIRILGRKGYLLLNALGDIPILKKVESDVGKILESVEFTEGNRYADYDSKVDSLAAYGIGGLIAGGLLKKAGLLALIGGFLVKGAKIIIVALIGLFYAVKKFIFGKGKSEDATASNPPPPSDTES